MIINWFYFCLFLGLLFYSLSWIPLDRICAASSCIGFASCCIYSLIWKDIPFSSHFFAPKKSTSLNLLTLNKATYKAPCENAEHTISIENDIWPCDLWTLLFIFLIKRMYFN